MPGPVPSRDPRRRNARPDWRRLPKAGYTGTVPAWPLALVNKPVLERWLELWRKPQAEAWADMGLELVVARYTTLCLEAEVPGAAATLHSEVRQLEDRLGLNPMSMRRLLWEIDEEPVEDGPTPAGVTSLADRRASLS